MYCCFCCTSRDQWCTTSGLRTSCSTVAADTSDCSYASPRKCYYIYEFLSHFYLISNEEQSTDFDPQWLVYVIPLDVVSLEPWEAMVVKVARCFLLTRVL